MQINPYFISTALVLLGVSLGSFAGATVWRIRARQLLDDKAEGDETNAAEYKKLSKLTKRKLLDDRSICLKCGYGLKWYDLIPIISWLLLLGKCRKCKGTIGYMEPLIELGVALFFVLSFMFWPYHLTNTLDVLRLIIWMMSGVGLAILFVYDMKWSILPDKVNYIVVGLGLIYSAIVISTSGDVVGSLASVFGSVVILSGIYLFLYIVSRGMWIGFGDVKLGLGLGLLLADWRLAFIALFAANLVGSLIVIPPMLMGKLKRNSHVPFGPLLIIGFVIASLAGNYLLDMFFYTLT